MSVSALVHRVLAQQVIAAPPSHSPSPGSSLSLSTILLAGFRHEVLPLPTDVLQMGPFPSTDVDSTPIIQTPSHPALLRSQPTPLPAHTLPAHTDKSAPWGGKTNDIPESG